MTKIDKMYARLEVLREAAQKALDADDMETAEKTMEDVKALEKKIALMKQLRTEEDEQLEAKTVRAASTEKTASFFRAVIKKLSGKPVTEAEEALLVPAPAVDKSLLLPDPVTAPGDNGEGYILPKDIRTKINQLMRDFRSMRNVVGTITTTALSGTLTVEDISGMTGLIAFSDGEELTASEDPQFSPVSFAMKEYGSIITMSNVLIAMTDNDLESYIARYFAMKATITENAKIIAKLKYGKTAKHLVKYTDLSSSINKDLDPAVKTITKIVTNQDGFDYLDSQLDTNGRPILQPDPTDATKMRFKGYPVEVFSNAQLPSDETYGAPVFYGALTEGVKFVTCGYYKYATSNEAGFTRNTKLARLVELFDVIQWDASDACYCFGYLKEAAVNPSQS